MILRLKNGKLLVINKLHFNSDKLYYTYIKNIKTDK